MLHGDDKNNSHVLSNTTLWWSQNKCVSNEWYNIGNNMIHLKYHGKIWAFSWNKEWHCFFYEWQHAWTFSPKRHTCVETKLLSSFIKFDKLIFCTDLFWKGRENHESNTEAKTKTNISMKIKYKFKVLKVFSLRPYHPSLSYHCC